MDSTERFNRRKKARERLDSRRGLALVVDDRLVNELIHSEVDWDSVRRVHEELDAKYDFEFDVEVSEEEVDELLNAVEGQLDDERFRDLLTSCREEVLAAVVGPFGLGGLVSRDDKDGGNVDTLHNVRNVGPDGKPKPIYATDSESQAYDNRGIYDSNRVHSDRRYREVNKETSDQQKTVAGVEDGYTDTPLKQNSKKDLDHIKSASETHNDPGRVLAGLKTEELANIRENLTPTQATINRSKKAESMEKFMERLKKAKGENRKKIEKLESKGELTPNEAAQLREARKKQESYDAIVPDKALEADGKARKAQDRKINREYYTSKKFLKNTLATSGSQAYRMGLQQAIGLVLCEFFNATFDEIQDIYKNGFSAGIDDGRFIPVLKERLKRIAVRIAAKWKGACEAFRDGFISGFLSNLVTVVINAFVTTKKRIVRIIREGFYSLLKAIKLLCSPPEGMTFGQAAHEASKLIAAGLAVVGGVAVEEYIDKQLIVAAPWLEPLADILTTVVVGGFTGLATTLIVYVIDKTDFFGANEQKRHEAVMDRLEASLNGMFEKDDAPVNNPA